MDNIIVATLALGSRSRQGVARLLTKKETRDATLHAPRSAKSVREWTLTLPSELPLWELESQMDSWIFRVRLQGPKPIGWKSSSYHWKLLKLRCLKWACITHLDIWNTSYDQKKGHKSNWQFDSRPLKVRNWPDFLVFSWCVTYRWKNIDKGYNFASDLITIRGLHAKLWAPKVARVPIVGISGLGGQKTIWMWPPWRGAKYTIRRKVVASPKSRPWWVLWVRVCPWLVLSTKSAPTMH